MPVSALRRLWVPRGNLVLALRSQAVSLLFTCSVIFTDMLVGGMLDAQVIEFRIVRCDYDTWGELRVQKRAYERTELPDRRREYRAFGATLTTDAPAESWWENVYTTPLIRSEPVSPSSYTPGPFGPYKTP